VLAVKGFHTPTIIEMINDAKLQSPQIICVQNGVDNETLLSNAFGSENVIPATITSAVSISPNGIVNVDRERGMGIAAGNDHSLKIFNSFITAGFHTILYPNAKAMKWTKLMTNLISNASSAICDLSPSEILKHDRLFRLEIKAIEEVLNVMKGMQIPVVPLPKTPSKLLAFAIKNLPKWTYRQILIDKVSQGRGGKKPSLHIDLLEKRQLSEVGLLNGSVFRHAESLGLSAPVNKGLYQTLNEITLNPSLWANYRHKPDMLADKLLSGDFV
tara:strand:+ start:2932 stop:3747 length:816 start_codon:yes stop_codon:yes gene_type:complete